MALWWGKQKCTKENLTPVSLHAIEPRVRNSLSRSSGTTLQLDARFVHSTGMYLQHHWQESAHKAVFFVKRGFAIIPKDAMWLITA